MTATRTIDARGLSFTCLEAGTDGEPVLLLHGFPETSHLWTPLLPVLAGAGYQCLAPDQRGYSPGARPADVAAYRYEELAADVFALADAMGWDRFHLVGHDWGAIVGWAALSVGPARVASWTAMSVPHYAAFAQAVYDDPEEELYRGFLQMVTAGDGVIESMMAADDHAGLRGVWAQSPPDQAEAYASVLTQPGALTAALNWYRACDAHRRALDDPSFAFAAVSTPTLLLWGKDELYVRRRSVDLAEERMTGPYRVVEVPAGHWLVQEAFDQVRDETLAHLRANPL